jgi:hypothetical protein
MKNDTPSLWYPLYLQYIYEVPSSSDIDADLGRRSYNECEIHSTRVYVLACILSFDEGANKRGSPMVVGVAFAGLDTRPN